MKPIFSISGNQRQCRQSWDQIITHVKNKSGQDPNIQVVYCSPNAVNALPAHKWSTGLDVVNLLRSVDLFDSRPRVFKIMGLSDDYSIIGDYLKYIDGFNIVVFWGSFGYTKLGTKQWITGKTSKLYKFIKDKGKVYEHPTDVKSELDATRWVKEVVAEYGKEIETSVAKRIVELQGKNLDALSHVVQKIATYQTGKHIKLEDAEACCFVPYEDRTWDFIAALDVRDVDKALELIAKFYAEGKGEVGESFYGRISQLFGALLQHYQFLMMWRDVTDRQLNFTDASNTLMGFKKMTPSKLLAIKKGEMKVDELESRFTSYYISNNVNSASVQQVFKHRKGVAYLMLSDLYNCMAWCRRYSGDPSMLKLCIDTFVLVACGVMKAQDAHQIRCGE
jgi:hypothetical protein